MLAANEGALLADMMETYGISDTYEETSLPLWKYALFAANLRPNSRIQMIMDDSKADTNTVLLTAIYDAVNWLKWSQTAAAEKNPDEPPEPILRRLTGDKEVEENGHKVASDGALVFRSADDFEQEFERRRLEKLRGT